MLVCVVQLVMVTSLSAGDVQGPGSYHDAGEQAHAFPTVGVRHHVSVANGEEGDGDKPHGPQEVAGHFLLIMVPRESREGWSARTGPPSFITPAGAVPRIREPVTPRAHSDKGVVAGRLGGASGTEGA